MIVLNRDGYLEDEKLGLVHRHVYKLHFKKIPKGWIVHHIDGNKLNNSIGNLIAMPSHCHDQLHAWQRSWKKTLDLPGCRGYVDHYLDKTKDMQKELVAIQKRVKELKTEIKKRTKLHLPKK